MDKQNIISDLQRNYKIIKGFGVKRLGIFGSFQRGEQTTDSDIDFLVIFEPHQKTFRNFMGLCFFLEEIFQKKIDLLTPESLSTHFGSEILKEVEYVPFL